MLFSAWMHERYEYGRKLLKMNALCLAYEWHPLFMLKK